MTPAAEPSAPDIGIPADEITWLSWKPERQAELRGIDSVTGMPSLEKRESEFDLIEANQGGEIGGGQAFDNRCTIPPNAILEDTWFALQVTDPNADGFFNIELNQTLTAMIDESIEILTDLLSIPEVQDESEVAEEIQTVLENTESIRIYYAVYAIMVEDKVFQKSETKISKKITNLALETLENDGNVSILPSLREVCNLVTDACRILTLNTIYYAETIPDANQGKIDDAYSYIDLGNEYFETQHDDFIEYDVEWYDYKNAVKKYKSAWKKAMAAMPGQIQPSAEIDLLPGTQFECNVTVTLSYKDLELPEGSEFEFNPYHSPDEGETWIPIENFEINTADELVIFEIDHFTRFAWGLTGGDLEN